MSKNHIINNKQQAIKQQQAIKHNDFSNSLSYSIQIGRK